MGTEAIVRPDGNDVLVLEFTGLSADQKFDRLLKDVPAVRLDPLTAGRAAVAELPVLAEAIRDRLPAGPPAFVLAHCTAAPLALHFAAACQRRDGVWPHAVLFDPNPGSAADLRREFGVLYRNLGGDPEPMLARSADEDGVTLVDSLHEALFGLRGEVVECYGGDTDAEELADHLLGRYAEWLRFLWHVTASEPVHAAGPVSVITAEPPTGLSSLLADPAAALVRCQPTDGQSILVSEAAGQALHDILAAAMV